VRSTRRNIYVSLAVAVTAAVGGGAAVVTAPGATPQHLVAERRLEALEGHGSRPDDIRFGVQLDWATDSPRDFEKRSKLRPAVYGEFLEFPFRPEVAVWLDDKIQAVKAANGIFMLTLQPGMGGDGAEGLKAVTPKALADLGDVLRRWNGEGVPVIVRYGQEMNGSWYPWDQQPKEYVKSFRRVADAVHAAPYSRMLWSPNEGGGYPYHGGQYEAKPGTKAFSILDTNNDGRLTQNDDPYKPYWPGSQYVDWVGLSLYHFGHKYPWKANVLPENDKFTGKMEGNFHGKNGDERPVPNFYQRYAEGKNKPMAVSETSALFNLADTDHGTKGASNEAIKSAWMDQVLAADIPQRYPELRLINWFEQSKIEPDVQGNPVRGVDWRITADASVLAAFKARRPEWLAMAPNE
jgi:hypothetical protein